MNQLLHILERQSLSARLAFGLSAMLLMMLAFGLNNLYNIRVMNDQLDKLYNNELQSIYLSKDSELNLAIIDHQVEHLAHKQDLLIRQQAMNTIARSDTKLTADINELRQRVVNPKSGILLDEFQEFYQQYKLQLDQALYGQQEQFKILVDSADFQSKWDQAHKALSLHSELKRQIAAETLQNAEALASQSTWITVVGLLTAMLAGAVVAALLTRSINAPSQRLEKRVQQLTEGQHEVEVPHTDYPNEIGRLARCVDQLRHVVSEMTTQRWVKTNLAQLSSSLQQVTTYQELSENFLMQLGPMLELGHAVYYVCDDSGQTLKLAGSYAFKERKQLKQVIAVGDGILGQVAIDKQPIILTDAPEDYIQISSGLGQAKAPHLAVYPVIRNGRLMAVLEMASFHHFTERQLSLLEGALPLLAMSLEIMERTLKTKDLLLESQQQALALQEKSALLATQTAELERQQTELKVTEQWYRDIIKSAPDGLLVCDAQGIIVLANPQVAAMFGYTEDELQGQQLDVLVPDAIRPKHPQLRESYIATGTTRQMAGREVHGRCKDGNEISVDVSLAKLTALDGLGACVCASVRDVTERKAAEQKLQLAFSELEKSQALVQAVLDNSPTDIYVKNLQGQFLLINKSFSNFLTNRLNIEPESLIGHRLDDFFENELTSWMSETDQQTLEAGQLMEFEYSYGQGELSESRQLLKFPLKTSEGDAFALCVIGQDTSERKRMQLQMMRARDAAEAATKAKSDFLANMSHEIRTPMNAIIGMSHLALQTELDKKQRNYIEKVHKASENLLGIINDILDFSKIEAGKLNLEHIPFRLEDVLENFANLVGMNADNKALELLFDLEPDLQTALVGDPLRLGQVLVNLGNNAVKFTEHGEIVVGVRTLQASQNQVRLHFWIRDTGIGMNEEQCARLFQSFSQADSSTTRKYGGTGLGLAISKNLIEMMDGQIWVDSRVGEGSCFHFEVNLSPQTDPVVKRMLRADELTNVRALVVDDNAMAREILVAMSQHFGLATEMAEDGTAGLAAIARAYQQGRPFDIVLMDWKMPGLDGIETIQQLQSSYEKTPAIVMVTAFGREDAQLKAEQVGVHLPFVLSKPVTPSTLLEAIGHALGKSNLVETRQHQLNDIAADSTRQLQAKKVLLVEDNEMNQELALELLQQAGITVVLAENGAVAVDLLRRDSSFDGVLMDCQMPVLDGYEATRLIRNELGLTSLPILAMTANAMEGDRQQALAAGMNDHIAKPLNISTMFATMAKWFANSEAPGTQNATSDAEPHKVADLPQIKGLHTDHGLRCTMHQPELYRRMLRKFSLSNKQITAEMLDSLQQQDYSLLGRLAHTLKGNAGTIGALEVADAAAELEQQVQLGEEFSRISTQIQQLENLLNPILQGLEQFFADTPQKASAAQSTHPPYDWSAQLQKLLALLEHCDTSAIAEVDALESLPLATEQLRHMDQLKQLISGFEFEKAEHLLQTILQENRN
jgi:two-component system sensor histidine kinase/response regulator